MVTHGLAEAQIARLQADNARLREEQQELARHWTLERQHAERTEQLSLIAQELNADLDLAHQIAILQRHIIALTGLDDCCVSLLDEESDSLLIHCSTDCDAAPPRRTAQAGRRERPLAPHEFICHTGQPILTDDYAAECHRRGFRPRGERAEEPGRAWLGLPLRAGERAIGALTAWRWGAPIDAGTVEMLQNLAARSAVAIENARLYAAAERRHREEAAFSAIAQDLAAALDGDTLLDRIARHARTLLDADIGHLLLHNTSTDQLDVCGFDSAGPRPLITSFGTGEGLVGQIWRTGAPLASDDYRHDERFTIPARVLADPSIDNWVSAIALPITLGTEPLGVLMVGSRQRRHFTARDQDILARLATQAALAVRNLRLLTAEQARATRAEVLREIGRDLSANLDLDRLFASLRRHLTQLTGLSNYWVGLCDEARGARLSLWVEDGVRRREAEGPLSYPLPPSMFREVVEAGRTILTDDYVAECRRRGIPTAGYLADQAHRTWLGLPLQVRGNTIGVLALWCWGARISDEIVALLEVLAGQIATALDNAQLFAETERQRGEEAAFNAIARDLADSLDAEIVLDRIVRHARTLLGGDIGHINLHDPATGHLLLRAFSDDLPSTFDGTTRPNEGLAGYVWSTGRAARSDDYFADTRFSPSEALLRQRDRHPHFSAIAVPITLADECLGTVTVGKRERHTFTAHDEAILIRLATQAALAVRNARLYAAAHAHAARLEVLNDIAREMSAEIDLDRFLASIWRHVHRIAPIDGYWVASWDDRAETLMVRHWVQRGERRREHEKPLVRATGRGLIWEVVDTQAPRHVGDYQATCRERGVPIRRVTAEMDTLAWFGLPLLVNGRLVGAMALWRQEGHFEEEESATLLTLANQIATTLENARLYREARQLAVTDPLTGLLNHRHLQERLDQELARAARQERPLAVAMLDLDNFKLFNDTYGHPAGDQILRTTAGILRAESRTTDILARYGGDEFCLVLPDTDREGALALIERIQVRCRTLSAQAEARIAPAGAAGEEIPLRVSAGFAIYPHDARDRHELVTRADVALYANKRGGRSHATGGESQGERELTASASFGVVEGLVLAVDAKDQYTVAHSQLVADTAVLLARALHLPEQSVATLRAAGMLHDVGKISIPDRILRKPGKLTDEEWQVMRQHVEFSELIIRGTPDLEAILEPVMHHHERWDGRGYPRGLAGEAVPLLGRIMIVADAYSAMVLDRPYRRGLSPAAATAQLRAGAGTQFDPGLVGILCDAIAREELQEFVNLVTEA